MSWSVLGESVTGTSHLARGVACQDAFRFVSFGASADWLVIAVADGAGSAAHSEVGARLACDELVNQVITEPIDAIRSREWAVELFSRVRDMVSAEAERRQVRPRELACTTLLSVVGPEAAAFVQLGDGGMVVGDGSTFRTVFWPEPAGYANATDFLTDDRFADALQFAIITDPIIELAVMTDGLQRLALDFAGRGPHPPFFRPLFRRLWDSSETEPLIEPFRLFLDSSQVNARTDDDKTLVLAVRRP